MVKCEFFDNCKHKFIRPKGKIIELKEEDLDIKSWCLNLEELLPNAQCVIRQEVLSVLVRGVY